MDPSGASMRKFVSEKTIEDIKKHKEEIGKKEEVYDPRTLYERLQESRKKKEDEFTEATKLGNMIHRIDDDESEYLKELINNENKKKAEIAKLESEAVSEFKKAVADKTVQQPMVMSDETNSFFTPKSSTVKKNDTNLSSKTKPLNKKSPFAGLIIKGKPESKKDSDTLTKKVVKRDLSDEVNQSEIKQDVSNSKKPKVDDLKDQKTHPAPSLTGLLDYDSELESE